VGVALERTGDFSNAVQAYEKAIELKPDYARAPPVSDYCIGGITITTGAIQEFQQAVMSDPDLAEGHYNLGLALSESGRLDEATRELNQAIGPRSQVTPMPESSWD